MYFDLSFFKLRINFFFLGPHRYGRYFASGPPKTPVLKTNEISAEIRQLLEEFHSNFRQRYITLKERHKLQVMQLECQRRVGSVAVRSTTEEITL